MVKKIDFQISRRQSGKTRSIVNMATRDCFCGRKPCIITLNQNTVRRLKQDLITKDIDVISSTSYRLIPSRPEVIYLDEYLYFHEDIQRFFNSIIPKITADVYIKSSASYIVDKEIFELARFIRKKNIDVDISFNDFIKEKQFNYLMNNLLTHPKTELNVDYDYYKSVLGEHNFQTEYLGKFLK